MKIEISKEEDRMTVAAILVKNGYRVAQLKEKRGTTNRSYIYYIEAEKVTQEVKICES